jgi:Tetracyclin repressor-like, C-terminal domain
VRHNLVNLIAEGTALSEGFQGSSSDLLVELIRVWWERVDSTSAGAIHKIVLSEVRNFPDLAQFYTDEVILPADALFSGAVQRGIERGEFRALPVHEVAHALMAPVIFMALHQHSFGACPVVGADIAPLQLLRTNLDLVLHGLQRRPTAAAKAARQGTKRAARPRAAAS